MTRATPTKVHRIEVRPSERAGDPLGASIQRSAMGLGVRCERVRTARIYLVQGALDAADVERLRTRLLTDPVLEHSVVGHAPLLRGERIVEVHPLPGVMDPVAQTVEMMVRELTGAEGAQVMTGRRYDIAADTWEGAELLARSVLSNPVIEQVHFEPWLPESFPLAPVADQTLRRVALLELSDDDLLKLSREGHLFLSLDEMRAIQGHFREREREPTDIELETLAQTWSEHCVHKTLKSTVTYRGDLMNDVIRWEGRPGHTVNSDGSVTITNLLKSTVAAATHELIAEGADWALSVFVDNAGVIAFDEKHAINVKVETHNHPSAIEPYGGAATGIGGCIRDVIATGLGAKPIAATDVFCVAFPESFTTEGTGGHGGGKGVALPPGCLHPKRVLARVVDGVRDYGNRMGIPTVSGAVYFDDRYVGNPLVFCGCVGLMDRDKIRGVVGAGDRIIALGGRTGRDGIHGATFSSAELTDTHADEFSHAVQIGNAIEEKRVLDVILRARDYVEKPSSHQGIKASSDAMERSSPGWLDGSMPRCLFSAMTDCGAGGFSSAVGEMGKDIGAEVHLERAPLKYDGLRYDEVWISESQERLVLAVPPGNVEALRAVCREESVEMADLGAFGTASKEIILNYRGMEVGRLACDFLHDGIPMPVREAVWEPRGKSSKLKAQSTKHEAVGGQGIKETLLKLLAHPNIASKRSIIRQYDHEVQGNTVIKPLVGPGGIGPGDATVIQPVAGSKRGIAIACGLATPLGDPALGGDPYLMAIAAVDECVRNLVCVGANPDKIAILDNFCWPSCAKPENLASLVRAAEGCYDAAKAYRTPFISGKDSLNNQFRYRDTETGKEITIEIPPTLLITGVGIVEDVGKCVTMDLKAVGETILVAVSGASSELFGSMAKLLQTGPLAARSAYELVRNGDVLAAHDSSEGGILTAIAEMVIASGIGARIHEDFFADEDIGEMVLAFGGTPAMFILQVSSGHYYDTIEDRLREVGLEAWCVGIVEPNAQGIVLESRDGVSEIPLADLRRAFLGPLE